MKTTITDTFQAGYARQAVLPTAPIGLPGFANADFRRSTEVRDPVCVSCIAFSQGDDAVLLFSVDIISIDMGTTRALRKALCAETGIAEDRIMICATHTHSGPGYYEEDYFKNIFLPGFIRAAKDALSDLSPATIYGTKTQTERSLSSLRHFITFDGEYVGSWAIWDKKVNATVARCARETDREMILLKFAREGKKDICLINWQCHPCGCYEKDTYLSADFIATVRTKVEMQTGMDCIYFTGASGDVIRGCCVPSEKRVFDSDAEFGALVADTALAAMDGQWAKIQGEGIRSLQTHFEYTTNRIGIERLEDAKKVKACAEQYGSFEKPEPNDYAKSLGFSSARECATIVMNANKPEKTTMELNVLSVGGVAFVCAPYEMFAESGMFIKENSPFDFTVVNALSNAYFHYFPVREAYEANNIYEAKTADFSVGVAEATADQFVSMLKNL